MGIAASAASRSRLRWSCCRAPRPIVRPSVAAVGWTGALIWDANLGFDAGAAQEFRLVDDRDPERLRLFELRPRVGPDDHRRGLLRHAVGDMPARGLDQLRGPGARERGQRSGDHERLTGERPLRLSRRRFFHIEAELLEALRQLLVLGVGEKPDDRLRDRRPDTADLADLVGAGLGDGLPGAEIPRLDLRSRGADVAGPKA